MLGNEGLLPSFRPFPPTFDVSSDHERKTMGWAGRRTIVLGLWLVTSELPVHCELSSQLRDICQLMQHHIGLEYRVGLSIEHADQPVRESGGMFGPRGFIEGLY